MRVFKIADGSSWVARRHDSPDDVTATARTGWEAIVFEAAPDAVAQRLVYRPHGWLEAATPADLADALREGVTIRVRWGD